jgi:hypothetical protein
MRSAVTHPRVLADGSHVPLSKLALCLDCDECFELGREACPACGSSTWAPAGRFLRPVSAPDAPRNNGRRGISRRAAEDRATAKHLLIVARNRPELYEQIKRAFAGHHNVQVVLDRRANERRRTNEPTTPDRRRAARRARSVIDDQLRSIGWALVLLDLAESRAD